MSNIVYHFMKITSLHNMTSHQSNLLSKFSSIKYQSNKAWIRRLLTHMELEKVVQRLELSLTFSYLVDHFPFSSASVSFYVKKLLLKIAAELLPDPVAFCFFEFFPYILIMLLFDLFSSLSSE